MLQTEGLSVRAGGRHLIEEITVAFAPGQFTLLSGDSGAGKTTLARCLAGFIPHARPLPMSGTVTVEGVATSDMTLPEIAARVGLVLQEPEAQLFNLFVADEIAFAPRALGLLADEVQRRSQAAAEALDIAHLMQRRVTELSGGEKQRVVIASALTMQPRWLTLDEPLSQLDGQGRAELARTLAELNERGAGVIVIEQHTQPLAHVAAREVVMRGGTIIADGAPRARASDADATARWEDMLTDTAPSGGEELVRLEGAHLNLQGRPALVGVDLSMRRGETLAIVGPNGAGKTSVAEIMAGLARPSAGRVWQARGLRVGLAPQEPSALLLADTTREEIEIGAAQSDRGAPAPDELLEALGLAHLAGQPPSLLSAGEVRRLAIAAALAGDPELIILDEPTAGQHPEALAVVEELVADQVARGAGAVLITHDRDLVRRRADRVVIMRGGEVVTEGRPIGGGGDR
jgi:energy-coupling factor transport system ATP-binding protein